LRVTSRGLGDVYKRQPLVSESPERGVELLGEESLVTDLEWQRAAP
jgi:hypothetical protein